MGGTTQAEVMEQNPVRMIFLDTELFTQLEGYLTPMLSINEIGHSHLEGATELVELAREAEEFLMSQSWCKRIVNGYLDRGWPPFLAVLYFEIEPVGESADDHVWVIVGDLPPAYMDTPNCPNGATALEAYLLNMEEWADAILQKQPIDDLIPVLARESLTPVAPSRQRARELKSRMQFIRRHILSQFPDELRQ